MTDQRVCMGILFLLIVLLFAHQMKLLGAINEQRAVIKFMFQMYGYKGE